MKKILCIGHNDLRMFLRDKASYIWLFIIPMVFTYFMGFANRGPGGPANPQPAVLMDNQDQGFLGNVFLDELGTQGLRRVPATNRDEAKRGIRIPTHFTERILRKERVQVELFTVAGSGEEAAVMIELRLVRALIAFHAHLVEQAAAARGQPLSEESLRQVMQRDNPVELKSSFAGRKPMPVGYSFSLPGNLVAYLLMNLTIFGGASLAWERRNGILRRLWVYPLSRQEIILGKLYGLMLLGWVQIGFFLLAGRMLFHVNVGDQLPAILLALTLYAWVAASLGLLIGSWVTAEEKVVGLCVLASIAMAALGGCWWPIEMVPDTLKAVAYCFPTAWAMDALHQLITFGGGLAQAKEALGVLLLFGVATNWAAARYFRI
jgi:ABC-type multidrug transport system permease subunit